MLWRKEQHHKLTIWLINIATYWFPSTQEKSKQEVRSLDWDKGRQSQPNVLHLSDQDEKHQKICADIVVTPHTDTNRWTRARSMLSTQIEGRLRCRHNTGDLLPHHGCLRLGRNRGCRPWGSGMRLISGTWQWEQIGYEFQFKLCTVSASFIGWLALVGGSRDRTFSAAWFDLIWFFFFSDSLTNQTLSSRPKTQSDQRLKWINGKDV